MSSTTDTDALRRVSEHAGRLAERCRGLARAAMVIERELLPGQRPAAERRKTPRSGQEAPGRARPVATIPIAELRQVCDAARDLRPLWEATMLSVAEHTGRVTPPVPDGAPPRVLVAEDAADLRDLLSALIEQSGLDAVPAADGLEALILAHACRPSLVLMDVSMPVLDGIAATRLLKTSAMTRDIPVVAHTALPQVCHEVAAEHLFAEVLKKPAAPAAIVRKVRQYTA